MKTEETKSTQAPASPDAVVEFVKVEIVESTDPAAKPAQELNGAKMNC